jgi:hypothetical protein
MHSPIESACGFCGEHITLIWGDWTDDDGVTACSDTSAPFVPHGPAVRPDMNYREQRELRDIARGASRLDLVAALDKTAEDLDELHDITRDTYRMWQEASRKQDAKAAELKEVARQIRELSKLRRALEEIAATRKGRDDG